MSKYFHRKLSILAAQPSPGFNFNIAMYGDTEEEVDGTQLSAEWAFSSLQMFGQEFLKKLRGKKLPNKLLEKVIISVLILSGLSLCLLQSGWSVI